jgi:hypothetical protein
VSKFYAYMWLREDGTPYYAGKGSGRRAYRKHSHHSLRPPKDRSRILVFMRATEAEALVTERELIANWGRKDSGTGCLRNFTDGGDGVSGLRVEKAWNKGIPMSVISKKKLSVSKKGQRHSQSEETRRKIGVAQAGKIVSAETRKKQSAAKKGKPSLRKGKTASLETRLKQSLAKKGRSWTKAQWVARGMNINV